MKRAQFAPGIVMTLIAWLMLAIIVLLLLLVKSNGTAANTTTTAVEAASSEAILTAYLQTSITLGGDSVPLAEALVHDILNGKNDLTKAPSEQFMTLLPKDAPKFKLHRITIILPDGTGWKYGQDFFTGTEIKTKLPLPDGQTFTVSYTQTNVDIEFDATAGIPI